MNKLTVLLCYIFFSGPALGGGVLSYDDHAPTEESHWLETISGSVEVSVYFSGSPENPDSFKQGDTYLHIEEATQAWWVHTPAPYAEIGVIEFVDDSRLLVRLASAAATATAVLNLENRELYSLGSGVGKIIRSGVNEGLVQLTGQYSFDSDGRFWYSSISDLQGRVVEFLAEGPACLPISAIISSGTDTSLLRQEMTFCVGIYR